MPTPMRPKGSILDHLELFLFSHILNKRSYCDFVLFLTSSLKGNNRLGSVSWVQIFGFYKIVLICMFFVFIYNFWSPIRIYVSDEKNLPKTKYHRNITFNLLLSLDRPRSVMHIAALILLKIFVFHKIFSEIDSYNFSKLTAH